MDDLFSKEALEKLNKEDAKILQFYENNQYLELVSSLDKNSSFEDLLKVKLLFQKMLPKMPREYILRQVFDQKHISLILRNRYPSGEIISAVCYRPAFDRSLVEIVFFAVETEYHVSGYGTFMFNCFKEVCKFQYKKYLENGNISNSDSIIIKDLKIFEIDNTIKIGDELFRDTHEQIFKNNTSLFEKLNKEKFKNNNNDIQTTDINRSKVNSNLYLLTYADNSAIGFFKKQGFTTHPISTQWKGYIKDYEGGTLMECKVHYGLNYLKKKELVVKIRNVIFEEMKKHNEYHIIRKSDDILHLNPVYSSLKKENKLQERSREEFLNGFICFLISNLQSNPSAWPFLEPVNTRDVPDYLDIIKNPIDLDTIYKRHKSCFYTTLKEFSDDIYLMIANCRKYNGVETQYYKCADIIQFTFENLLSKYSEVIKLWNY